MQKLISILLASALCLATFATASEISNELIYLSDGSVQCPNLHTATYRDNENCEKYYACSNGNITHKKCVPGTYYSYAHDGCGGYELDDCDAMNYDSYT